MEQQQVVDRSRGLIGLIDYKDAFPVQPTQDMKKWDVGAL